MVANAITFGLDRLQDAKSVRIVILRAAAEIDVEVHVLADTFVSVERMELESFVESNSQTIDNTGRHQ